MGKLQCGMQIASDLIAEAIQQLDSPGNLINFPHLILKIKSKSVRTVGAQAQLNKFTIILFIILISVKYLNLYQNSDFHAS